MSQTITIHLSENLYHHVKQAAELSHQATEAIIIQSLRHTLPPLLEDIPEQYQPDVYPLLHMNDVELQQECRHSFPPKRWTDYETLLDKKKTSPLTAEEERRLATLHREADVFMFRRSYAAVLLKRRGYHLPTLQELLSSQ
ncbi:MAG: hypothetical protein GY801_14650 [bacterium]|nr:hypothetical protein [bacterium]